ncbi:exonuclease mut-7 homolog isoform X1 [Dermacentor variabilis]|uniref:exonuclease mut-7 homolog isoform X1 n=1 Tax=Dermacentor variabilis TaxID=34621 RepID=UPI003F5BA006
MDPMWSQHLEAIWHSGRSKKTEPLVKVLQTYFGKSSNCFECAFLLMRAASDFHKNRLTALSYTIMTVFQEWLLDHSELYPILLTKELKRRALMAVLKQTNTSLIDLVCRVYKLKDESMEYMDIVQDLLIRKHFNEASTIVSALKLHGYFTIEEIAIPLFLMDKMTLLENYMEGLPELQKDVVTYLDGLFNDGNRAEGVINTLNVKMISRDKIHPKTLAKVISRLLKLYNLPVELCPHVHYSRSKSALKYLIYKRYHEGDFSEASWREMICEAVGSNPTLQQDLLNELMWVKDYENALSFALKLGVPDHHWPRYLRTFRVQCGQQKVQELLKSWNLNCDKDDPSKYLPLRIDLCDVHMVDTADALDSCIEVIKDYDVVGIDAEWKPTMGLTPSRLSLVQLAVWDNVYVLDMLKLSETLTEAQWAQLYTGVLSSNEILKLGFGIAEDLKLLSETIKCPESKVHNVVDLCSFVEKLRCDYPNLMKPVVPKERGHKGLSELTRILLGLPLNKDEQCSDWENRPLRQSQMKYAALDAFCLLQVYEELYKRAEAEQLNLRDLIEEAKDGKGGTQLRQDRSRKYKSQLPTLGTLLPPCLQQAGEEMTSADECSFVRSDQPLPVAEFRIIADTMVQGLGRYLRLCGIDTIILRDGDDRDQAVKLAQKENRVILTCGAPYKKMKQYVAREQCFCVNNVASAREQLKDVLKFYNVVVREKDILTRCTECNASHYALVPSADMWQLQASLRDEGQAAAGGEPLVRYYGPDCSIDFTSGRFNNGKLVQCDGLVFEYLSHVETFYVCVACGKVYWDGSHHGRFRKQLWLADLISDEPPPASQGCADRVATTATGCCHQSDGTSC